MKKNILTPILLTVFIDLLGVGIVIPILASLFLSDKSSFYPTAVTMQTRTLQLGILTALYPLMQFIGSPILGALSDRHGRKPILLLSLAGTFLGYLLFAIGVEFHLLWLLFVSRMLDGFTGGNISTAMSAIADVSKAEDKAKNFGLIGMAFGVGFILGPFLGGVLSDNSISPLFSFQMPFFVAAALSLINIVVLQINFDETLKSKIHKKISIFTGIQNIIQAFSFPNLRVLFGTIFLYTLGFSFFTQFFQVFLIEKFNYTQSQIGFLFGYMGLWIAFTQGFLIRKINHKGIGPRNILSVTLLIVSLGLLCLLVPSKAIYLYVIFPFIAMGNGLTMPNVGALISNNADRESQGEILGINQSIQALGQGIPPIIAGIIVSSNKNAPILVASTIIFLSWIIFMFFNSQQSKKFHEV